MPTIIEKIGSRDTEVGGLFQPTRIPVTLIVKYDCSGEIVPEVANDVLYDLADAGYIVEINRPYGRPPVGQETGTQTPVVGFPANVRVPIDPVNDVVGFEVVSYRATRDQTATDVFIVEIVNELVEFQEYNHAEAISQPTTRTASVWRANPDLPTLESVDDPGVLVDDPLLEYDMATSINGRKVDINTQPISTPLNGNRWVFSCVQRRPYFKLAGDTTLTTDTSYEYWFQDADLLGGRLADAARLFSGNTGEGDYEPVIEDISFEVITGTFVRMNITIRTDEELNLTQVPLSVDGTIPEPVPGYSSSTAGLKFKILQAKSVAFMDPFPRVADMLYIQLPANVLGIWQAYAGGVNPGPSPP